MQHYLHFASSIHNARFGIDLLKICIHKKNKIFQRPFSLGFLVGVFFPLRLLSLTSWDVIFTAFHYGERLKRNCSLYC